MWTKIKLYLSSHNNSVGSLLLPREHYLQCFCTSPLNSLRLLRKRFYNKTLTWTRPKIFCCWTRTATVTGQFTRRLVSHYFPRRNSKKRPQRKNCEHDCFHFSTDLHFVVKIWKIVPITFLSLLQHFWILIRLVREKLAKRAFGPDPAPE